MANLDRLIERVRAAETVMDSAGTLLSTLAAQVRASAGDRDAANALADEIDAKTASLSKATTDNTIASTETPATPGVGDSTEGGVVPE